MFSSFDIFNCGIYPVDRKCENANAIVIENANANANANANVNENANVIVNENVNFVAPPGSGSGSGSGLVFLGLLLTQVDASKKPNPPLNYSIPKMNPILPHTTSTWPKMPKR